MKSLINHLGVVSPIFIGGEDDTKDEEPPLPPLPPCNDTGRQSVRTSQYSGQSNVRIPIRVPAAIPENLPVDISIVTSPKSIHHKCSPHAYPERFPDPSFATPL